MPFNQCPHKKEPGYTASKRCTAPCGGWVVLYKREKMESARVRDHEDNTFHWVLVHQPSRNWTGIVIKADALTHLAAAAKGEDHHGILPATVPTPEELERLKAPSKKVKKSATNKGEEKLAEGGEEAPSGGGNGSPARARGEGGAPQESDVPHALAFQRSMQDSFGAERVVKEIEAGLAAVRAFMVGKGDDAHIEEVPDHQTRVKYLEMVIKYNIGMPEKRDKLKEDKKVTFDELRKLAETSPAARRTLRRMLEEAERNSAEALKPKPAASAPPAPES